MTLSARNRVLERAATNVVAALFWSATISCARNSKSASAMRPAFHAMRNPSTTRALKIGAAARKQGGDVYDQNYHSISFFNGDVPRGRGACTDVIVRSLRAVGYDLQKLTHDDKKRHRNFYPHNSQHSKLDPNIDHRRVPNQRVYFQRFGQTLTNAVTSSTRSQWKAGDIVQWKFADGLDHTGIISDKTRRAVGRSSFITSAAARKTTF